MRWYSILTAAAALLPVSAASQSTISVLPGDAFITIEASHGGAGTGLTNTTIDVPLDSIYADSTFLATVSYLFLVAATGVPLESITCTPYLYANGTGTAGLPFTSSKPSLLSTNTVSVGSIVCVSGSAPSGAITTAGGPSTTTGNVSSTGGVLLPTTAPTVSSYSVTRVTPVPDGATASSNGSAPSSNISAPSSNGSAASGAVASSTPTSLAAASTSGSGNSITQLTVLTTSQSGNPTAQLTVTSVVVVPPGSAGASGTAQGHGSSVSAAAAATTAPSTVNAAPGSRKPLGEMIRLLLGIAVISVAWWCW